MAELNGGQLLARCLANEGVRFVFGLPSPEIDPLLAALDEHGIRLVPVRHEAAGAHMAEGLYKTTGPGGGRDRQPRPGLGEPARGRRSRRGTRACRCSRSPRSTGSASSTRRRRRPSRGRISSTSTSRSSSGAGRSSPGTASRRWCASRSARCGRAGPGPVQIELPAPVLYATGDEASVRVSAPAAYRAALPEASEARIARGRGAARAAPRGRS